MDNHVHLLLRTGASPIATVMRRLLTGYAVSYNRRHRRYGHLFQNRYKSILCEEDGYLKQLVAYIHLNPFRAGIVEDAASLRTFPYTGHSALMGKKKRPWQDTDYVLKLFGRRVSEARRNLQRHSHSGVVDIGERGGPSTECGPFGHLQGGAKGGKGCGSGCSRGHDSEVV